MTTTTVTRKTARVVNVGAAQLSDGAGGSAFAIALPPAQLVGVASDGPAAGALAVLHPADGRPVRRAADGRTERW